MCFRLLSGRSRKRRPVNRRGRERWPARWLTGWCVQDNSPEWKLNNPSHTSMWNEQISSYFLNNSVSHSPSVWSKSLQAVAGTPLWQVGSCGFLPLALLLCSKQRFWLFATRIKPIKQARAASVHRAVTSHIGREPLYLRGANVETPPTRSCANVLLVSSSSATKAADRINTTNQFINSQLHLNFSNFCPALNQSNFELSLIWMTENFFLCLYA